MEKLGTKIVHQYEQSSKLDDFYPYVSKISAQEAVSIYVFYDSGNNNLVNMFSSSLGLEVTNIDSKKKIFTEYIKNSDITKPDTFIDSNNNVNEFIVYMSFLDERNFIIGESGFPIYNCNVYMVIESKIDPISAELTILNQQILFGLILAIFLSTLITYYISLRISYPITKICEQATKLSSENYDTVFFAQGYQEIDDLADALNHMRIELAQTTELQKKLIANISHDLRTPLTLIKSYAEMVRDLSFSNEEKRNKHLNVIIDETDRLTLLVQDILALSKLQSKIDDIKKEEFNLSELVKRTVGRFDILTQRDGYQFILNIKHDIIINADIRKIEQAIYNLLANSVNYTGEDKIVIVNLFIKNSKIRFEVVDSGKGIDESEIEDIWMRYYRSKDPHKRASIGTGLGLTIVKEVFVSHGYNYGVLSTKGEGSTFWVEIPL